MSFANDYINRARGQRNGTGNYRNMTSGAGFVSPRSTTFGANGVAAGGSANPNSQSQPYIIQISNASAAVVSNFDVFGAWQYILNSGFSGGSLTISGVTISSNISNVTYQNLLNQSQFQPFQIGLTYIQSVSGPSSQITQSITLTTQDANGNQATRTLVPTYDPYQNLSTVVALQQAYAIDGFTKLTISQILASAVFQMQFYPSVNVNPANPLGGAPVTQGYSKPYVVKALGN